MAAADILDNFEWPYLRNGSRSTYIARIARSSLRYHSFLVYHLFVYGLCYSPDTATISNVDANKLWRDVQNEVTVICVKFGKDLFNFYKVLGHRKGGPVFCEV